MAEIPLSRKTGELLVELEFEADKSQNGLIQRCRDVLAELVTRMPEAFQKSVKLSELIERLKRAQTVQEVEHLILEGMKLGVTRVLSQPQTSEAKADPFRKSLLVYIGNDVWGPVEWGNEAHKAFIINARRALGRIKSLHNGSIQV